MGRSLIVDTETTGKIPHHARLCQLACVLVDDQYRTMCSAVLLVRPEGFEVPEEAEKIHGHSTEKLTRHGVSLKAALSVFGSMLMVSDVVVAHNSDYDRQVLAAEMTRVGWTPPHVPWRCTMKETTDICKLPGQWAGKYKWPKLDEAYKVLTGQDLIRGQHDALEDCLACLEIYKKLPPI